MFETSAFIVIIIEKDEEKVKFHEKRGRYSVILILWCGSSVGGIESECSNCSRRRRAAQQY